MTEVDGAVGRRCAGRRRSRPASSCRRRWGRRRATFSPRSSTRSTSCDEGAGAGGLVGGADGHRRRLHLEHHAGRGLGLGQAQTQPLRLARRRLHPGLDALDLRELGLGLLRLVLLGVEAVVEALQLLDLLEVLLVAPPQQVAARRPLADVGREVAGDRLDVLVLDRQDPPAHALEQPAVVRDEDEGPRVVEEELLEPLDRVDVEVVRRLVEQEQIGVGEQRAGQGHACEFAARQRVQTALEHLLGQAEALGDSGEAAAVRVAAELLEATLELLVRAHRVAQLGAVLVEARHGLFGRPQPALEGDGVAEGLGEVVADRTVGDELGRLLVEPDPASAGASDRALIRLLLVRHEAQDRRLAAPVSTHQDRVVVAVEGEGDVGEQALAAVGLLDVVEGDDAHGRGPGLGSR